MDPVPDFPQFVSLAPVPVAAPVKLPWYSPRRLGYNFLTLSILLHVLFGFAAGFLIVATIYAKKKPDFQAPGPKGPNAATRALEHKVSMAKKQNSMSAPPNAKRVTTTGLSKTALPAMPSMPKMDVVVPATMSGLAGNSAGIGGFGSGGGSGGGGGGGGGLNFFGLRSNGTGLVGTFYDLKQNRGKGTTGMTPQKYAQEVGVFLSGGWNVGVLAKYYQGPQKLSAQQVFIPTIPADEGPEAFGLQKEVKPSMWLVHYKGTVTPSEGGTYRFVGAGDDILAVRFDGKLVLLADWNNPFYGVVQSTWRPQGTINYHWPPQLEFPGGFVKGDQIEVVAGKPYAMEVLIGEQPGGSAMAALLIQKPDASYDQDDHGNPLLPVFRLAKGPLPAPKGGGYAPHAEKDGPVWRSINAPSAGP